LRRRSGARNGLGEGDAQGARASCSGDTRGGRSVSREVRYPAPGASPQDRPRARPGRLQVHRCEQSAPPCTSTTSGDDAADLGIFVLDILVWIIFINRTEKGAMSRDPAGSLLAKDGCRACFSRGARGERPFSPQLEHHGFSRLLPRARCERILQLRHRYIKGRCSCIRSRRCRSQALLARVHE
jgi:hypothetical protein